MTEKPYETARVGELEGADGWAPIRRHFDVRAFGINSWTAGAAGASLIPEHDEAPSGHEELYLVLSGSATFVLNGDEVSAPAGTIVFVRDPDARRSAVAEEPGTTVVAVGGRPGAAYQPRSWETNVEVIPLIEAGKYAEAKVLLTDALTRYEDRATLNYNLACTEALLGEVDQALEHLQAAVRERPSLARNAESDSDLDAIRDDPGFAAALV